jgi:hypothetical protein
MFRVGFGRLSRMVGRMEVVSVRDVGMVRGFLVMAGLMVFRRFPMMVRGVLVVFSGLQVMFCCLFGHVPLLRLLVSWYLTHAGWPVSLSPFPETVSYVPSVHTAVFSHRPSDTVKGKLSEWPAGD